MPQSATFDVGRNISNGLTAQRIHEQPCMYMNYV